MPARYVPPHIAGTRRRWHPIMASDGLVGCTCMQDILRSKGVVIDESTVIKQAQVTALADSNSEWPVSHRDAVL